MHAVLASHAESIRRSAGVPGVGAWMPALFSGREEMCTTAAELGNGHGCCLRGSCLISGDWWSASEAAQLTSLTARLLCSARGMSQRSPPEDPTADAADTLLAAPKPCCCGAVGGAKWRVSRTMPECGCGSPGSAFGLLAVSVPRRGSCSDLNARQLLRSRAAS